jgi:hypothetical protein
MSVNSLVNWRKSIVCSLIQHSFKGKKENETNKSHQWYELWAILLGRLLGNKNSFFTRYRYIFSQNENQLATNNL